MSPKLIQKILPLIISTLCIISFNAVRADGNPEKKQHTSEKKTRENHVSGSKEKKDCVLRSQAEEDHAHRSSAKEEEERIDTTKVDILDTLRKVEPGQRKKIFSKIYRQQLWHLDSAEVLRELERLERSSIFSNDKELKLACITVKGLYYQQRVSGGLAEGIEILKDALKKSEEYQLKESAAKINHFIGYTYFLMEKYPSAFEYMLNADKMMRDIGYGRISDYCRFSYRLGVTYFRFSNDERAVHYLKLASEYAGRDVEIQVGATSLIGSIFLKENDYEHALHWYKNSLHIAERANDSIYFGIIYGNLGHLYFKLEREEYAESLCEKAYRLSERYGDYQNAAVTLLNLIDFKIKKKDVQEAYKYIKDYRRLISAYPFNNTLEQKVDYEKTMADFYALKKNYRLSNDHLKSHLALKDSLQEQKDANMVANLEVEIVTEKHMTEMSLMEEKASKQKIIRNTSWVISAFALFLLGGVIYNLKLRQRRQQQDERILTMEKEKAVLQAKSYRERLKFFIEGIRERNRLIEDLKKKEYIHSEVELQRKDLEDRLYESVILTEEDWQSFKKLFENAYPGFMKNIQTRYPQLTAAEIRLCSLIKLNLSVVDMAGTLGISQESVRKARRRLYKKLGLGNHREIPNLIGKF